MLVKVAGMKRSSLWVAVAGGGNINIVINIDNNFEGTEELRRTVKRTVSESLRERGLIGVG